MKLKRSELRRIIKEELSDIVQEGSEDLRILVKFEGGSLKFEYGEVQVHIDGENTVLHVPPSAILELAKKLPADTEQEFVPPKERKEITVTQSQVDDLERRDQLQRMRGDSHRTARTPRKPLTDLQKQDRRWRLGL